MDVKNVLVHMQNQWISIKGRNYQCDQNGIVRGMLEADARQLVERRGSPWSYHTERMPVSAPTAVASTLPPPPPVSEPLPLPPTPEVVAPVVPPPVAVEEASTPAGAEKIPGPGEEWPDPDASMSMEYLHQMAHAYQVKFPVKISKAALLRKLKAAMYE